MQIKFGFIDNVRYECKLVYIRMSSFFTQIKKMFKSAKRVTFVVSSGGSGLAFKDRDTTCMIPTFMLFVTIF